MQKRFWLVLGTFLLAMLLYIDRILVSVAKSDITADLALTDKQMGCTSKFSDGSVFHISLYFIPVGLSYLYINTPHFCFGKHPIVIGSVLP